VTKSAAHTALHASLNATLHTALDLSGRVAGQREDRSCEEPSTEYDYAVADHDCRSLYPDDRYQWA
jgi:hypothetical protein